MMKTEILEIAETISEALIAFYEADVVDAGKICDEIKEYAHAERIEREGDLNGRELEEDEERIFDLIEAVSNLMERFRFHGDDES